eukprot:357491-Chlamydomonas_euryale.AAC.3
MDHTTVDSRGQMAQLPDSTAVESGRDMESKWVEGCGALKCLQRCLLHAREIWARFHKSCSESLMHAANL